SWAPAELLVPTRTPTDQFGLQGTTRTRAGGRCLPRDSYRGRSADRVGRRVPADAARTPDGAEPRTRAALRCVDGVHARCHKPVGIPVARSVLHHAGAVSGVRAPVGSSHGDGLQPAVPRFRRLSERRGRWSPHNRPTYRIDAVGRALPGDRWRPLPLT